MDAEKPRFWNVWWTLMVLSASFTAIVLVLEALGGGRDLGLVLGGLGVLLMIVFGFGAASRSFLVEFRGDVVPRLDGLRSTALHTNEGLEQANQRLDRVVALLDERLPRQSA